MHGPFILFEDSTFGESPKIDFPLHCFRWNLDDININKGISLNQHHYTVEFQNHVSDGYSTGEWVVYYWKTLFVCISTRQSIHAKVFSCILFQAPIPA